MGTVLKEESTMTVRYQTTIPSGVRKVLGLQKNDKVNYLIQPDGRVVLERAIEQDADPVLGQFLKLLAGDLAANPDRIEGFGASLQSKIESLISDIDVNLDEALSDEGE